MNPPTGTVTFLFTDIEGSTRLWEERPEAMRQALARHDALLRQAIETHNGHVFKTIGDAFCAAFASPHDALAAALYAQFALHRVIGGPGDGVIGERATTQPPEDPLPLRVRMALHTGTAQERDGDYFGPALNRVARLLATAHGQQVLLSETACEGTRDRLPEGCSLRDLGSHRLKDLQQPEHVRQLVHSSLPSDFPPLRSLQAFANNLPLQMTRFIGREKEMGQVKRLLASARLLTLTGAGGCGKTRLALQVAADLLETYPNGAWLVELAPLSDPSLVTQAAASVVGVREEPEKPILRTLTDYLLGKRLLLLLDNCEHLIDSCAALSDALLRACPHLHILASSREPLGLAGESVFRVPSLSVPEDGDRPSLEALARSEAVRLFTDRAALARPDFTPTDRNARAVAQVCRRLDGIPLAIELAAARVRALSVEQIAERLDDRFRLLTGGSRAAMPRQQTLRALIDWSHDLLDEQERALLRRLSVFAGGWTLDAAEEVCADESATGRHGDMETASHPTLSSRRPIAPSPSPDVLDLLTSLADKSLVVFEEMEEGTGRYRLLESIRQYARERLMESGESEAARLRHGRFFLSLAKTAVAGLQRNEEAEWLARLETEHDNLRAAFEGFLSDPAGAEAGLELTGALQRFWTIRGHLREGRERSEAMLSREGASGRTKTRAHALHGAGTLAIHQGDGDAARAFFEGSLEIRREREDRPGIAASLNSLAHLMMEYGDFARAQALLDEGLALRREQGDKPGTAAALCNLGLLAYYRRDHENARSLLEESLALERQANHRAGMASSLLRLAGVMNALEDRAMALRLYGEALVLLRELGDKPGMSVAFLGLGILAREEGDPAAASGYLAEGLRLVWEMGDVFYVHRALDEWGTLCCRIGRMEQAARVFGAIEDLGKTMVSPLRDDYEAERSRSIAAVRRALGEDRFSAIWDEGRSMTLEQAVSRMLEEVGRHHPGWPATPPAARCT